MKKTIITIGVATILLATTLISCNSKAKKVEAARQNVEIANQELTQALRDSIRDYKSLSEETIISYEKTIVELKANIAKQNKANKSVYEKDVAILEQRNKDMRKKLSEFNEENQEKWHAFKKEFSNDMDELGVAFKNFGNKDNK